MTDKIIPGMCNRCKGSIHNKDNFCRLTEWKQGKQTGEGWYHTHCFREGMHGNVEEKKLKAQAQNMMDRTMKVLENVEERFA